jgi:hypothetical protein
MLADSSRLRFAATLLASALTTLVVASSSAQTIDYSLNLTYAVPANPASGGAWELVAKTIAGPSDFGIADAVARISGIKEDAVLSGPNGKVNGGADPAGFQLFPAAYQATPTTPAFFEFTFAQVPNCFTQGLTCSAPAPGKEANLFYGVGTIMNGSPAPGANSIGPTFTSLTNTHGIPWAPGDAFLHDTAWDTAVSLATGSFAPGATPAFVAGSTGDVFTTIPPGATNNTYGNRSPQLTGTAITTTVRTNLIPSSADYNLDGIVSSPDYVLWRKTLGKPAVPAGSGADGDHDGTVNAPDYTLWRSHYGNPTGSGSGGGLSTGTVPEPASSILLTIGALLVFAPRRGRFQHPVNS